MAGLKAADAVRHDPARCLSCAGCVAVCAPGAIHMDGLAWEMDPAKCDKCGACVFFCPAEALELP